MDKKKIKEVYDRNLPHWQPHKSVLFMTVRLKGSLPKEVVLALKQDRELRREELKEQGLSKKELDEQLRKSYDFYFGKFDDLLDTCTTGPHWLKDDKVAQIWVNALNHFDNDRYKVACSTVMSNHVHFIFHKLNEPLGKIMHSLKSYTAKAANKVLDRTGAFWQIESFDRVIRDRAEFEYRVNYTLNNPVKAGIVSHWSEYKYNYICPDYKYCVQP